MARNENVFTSNTSYLRLVDLKKLKFILFAIEKYCLKNKRNLDEISILEIGCGEGNITIPMAALGCHVTAFDINKDTIAQLRKKVQIKNLKNIYLSVSDGYTFNEEKKYDIVVASEVLEHLEFPLRLLANIEKKMCDEAYFVITIPNAYGPYELRNRIIGSKIYHSNTIRKLTNLTPYKKIPGKEHVQFYKKTQLIDIMVSFKFELIDFSKSDSLFSILWTSTLKPIKQLEMLDIKLADLLHYWLASGWFFLFERSRFNKSKS